MSLNIRMMTLSLIIGSNFFSLLSTPALAQRAYLSGPRGRLNYGRGTYYGPYGGYVRGAGAAGLAAGGNAGFAAGAHNAVAPNGSTFNGAHAGAFKRGVGFFNKNAYSVQGANGNNLNHYSKSAYNAQTGKGFAEGANSGTINGKPVGDQYQFTGQKGEGLNGTVDTVNHGDYNVQVPAGGGKPVVTETQTPTTSP
ncbi:MAG: hypothetical protein C5B53_02580 [Candidatus Melainabacteria bacterium]|nr:MAG: hypothetical protein C5B53_02580 [Candidatus Melainabacteria bacterium]